MLDKNLWLQESADFLKNYALQGLKVCLANYINIKTARLLFNIVFIHYYSTYHNWYNVEQKRAVFITG